MYHHFYFFKIAKLVHVAIYTYILCLTTFLLNSWVKLLLGSLKRHDV
jgi:hypothetical protein